MKFGHTVEELEKDADYFDLMTNSFQQSCRLLAEALSFEVDEITTESSFACATRDLLDGRVKAGTVGGIHLQVKVMSKGSAVVTEDLMWYIDETLEPAWPIDPEAGEWQVTIDGDPGVKISAALLSSSGASNAGKRATAARMVNSISDVCTAAPGILTAATAPMPRCRQTG